MFIPVLFYSYFLLSLIIFFMMGKDCLVWVGVEFKINKGFNHYKMVACS